jgi:hypothetical protein
MLILTLADRNRLTDAVEVFKVCKPQELDIRVFHRMLLKLEHYVDDGIQVIHRMLRLGSVL